MTLVLTLPVFVGSKSLFEKSFLRRDGRIWSQKHSKIYFVCETIEILSIQNFHQNRRFSMNLSQSRLTDESLLGQRRRFGFL